MGPDEIRKILEDHKHWLEEDCDGWEKMGADLTGAYLRGAHLMGADLRGADLTGAYLRGAYLTGADLTGADLTGAYLTGAYLTGAYLRGADLTGAYLRGAHLTGADLRGADLTGAIGVSAPISCPDTGSFVAWKKAHEYIVKLLIPEDARRTSATTRKCRCDKAVVLAIETAEGEQGPEEVKSNYDSSFVYRTGETVSVKDFDEDRWNECSTGIHFFITREEAVAWC